MKLQLEFYFLFFPCLCVAKKKQNLQIIPLSKPVECSVTADNGDMVAVHYIGKLANGQTFDASKEEPIKFQLGVGRVIKGWDEGILGMCVGEKRQLVIPPDLAYGANGVQGVIPPHATLTFVTELAGLEKDSSLGRYDIGKVINFAIWPAIILGVLIMLYKRMSAAEERIKSEKSEKKLRKKKH
ncbi:FK506-binding 2-like [Paramuricea clavata]|uniref:peptidylprolyl isomerase n=1 Tax=Paramuricea clavata TaxID=317549 RepID=A0A7D9ICR5_PARCT|nr:FK506-binding 2-like [Paramuricea clavata]